MTNPIKTKIMQLEHIAFYGWFLAIMQWTTENFKVKFIMAQNHTFL